MNFAEVIEMDVENTGYDVSLSSHDCDVTVFFLYLNVVLSFGGNTDVAAMNDFNPFLF